MRYGRNLTDEDFLSLWRGPDRRAWADALAQIRRTATGMVAGVTAETMGSGFASFELVLLPLRGAAACDCAIGCMVRVGGHEETNRIKARIVAQCLDSHRRLGDLGRSHAERRPYDAPAPPATRPNLVVIDGSPPERPPLTRS